MQPRLHAAALAVVLVLLPRASNAQQANPVADAFRDYAKQSATNLIAAEEFPADKYSYKPTSTQMSVGEIVVHLIQGNDYLCGAIGGAKAPTRTKMAATDSRDALLAQLRESFAFCDQSLGALSDANLAEPL